MSILKTNLTVPPSVTVTSYFPARTKSNEGAYDWDVVKGLVVRNLYRKTLTKKISEPEKNAEGEKVDVSLERLQKLCREDFELRLDDPKLWAYLQKMYFDNDAFFDVAPESLLFKITTLSNSSPKNNLANMFVSLMGGFFIKVPVRAERNFLEQQVVKTLRSSDVLEDFIPSHSRRLISTGVNEKPYLPFLSECFKKDLKFLADHPRYLIEKLGDFLHLYGYLYTAQLALNMKGWKSGPPSPKPLYFMLEGEKASQERSELVEYGHQNVAKQIPSLFPYLSMSEFLQQADKAGNEHLKPLWELASSLLPEDAVALKVYAKEFFAARFPNEGYSFEDCNEDPLYWLDLLLRFSVKQFDKGQPREAALSRYVKEAETELCGNFVKSRGRLGKVLLMNQDYLSLMTNLVIPKEGKLRFHELIAEFNARGVFFDKQSQQALIRFYERVGNVERMSDSGDAVYVRSTI